MTSQAAHEVRPPAGPASAFAETVSADDFKAAFRNHPAGVSVITTQSADGPVGLTASSVFSVSVNPPLLVFSLSTHSSSTPAIRDAETIVIHLMGAGQLELAKTFATSGIDRFADTSIWSRLVTGEPILHSANAWLRGRIVNRIETGSSTVVAVQVLQMNVQDKVEHDAENAHPLVYHNRAWHSLSEASVVG
ncbi:flavin reductase family protein [Arthrobacter sp. ISL-5]|uniref:flavin reductase family protein n=1 Tax=Arthrobacter sp. ISL-5 TaxID=2819111 RepID=UPI001BE68408|nr:flavin reductase family protein [Arthrobacter sp. ISL-5]MBT2556023.1 flavin reductase family protein [Arthrobacter sp. ISL-5]